MIAGAHTIIFCEDPERAREFFRTVLGLSSVDAGGGWLIFALPPAEMAVHPGEGGKESRHELYFMCHDLKATIADLTVKGVEFPAPVSEERWGSMTRFKVPGAGEVGLYQPKHPSPLKEFSNQP